MNIVYSGSSLLQLEKAQGDLSRRQATYPLCGMSFREYLKLEGLLDYGVLSFEEILKNHVAIALMNALVPRVDIGVARETFFYSQVGKSRCVTYTGVGDFVVDGRWTFEVGGKGKGFSQISDVPDSFVVNDGVTVGRGNKIPLWLFGFLY